VNFFTGSERFSVLTWSRMCNIVGRWSESKISDMITPVSLIFWWTTMSNTSPFPAGE
jgi:hypothetical protein